MNELYFTKTDRKTNQVVRLEYGQLGEKYVLKTFEGEENPKMVVSTQVYFPKRRSI